MAYARDDYRTVADLEEWALAVTHRRTERARALLELVALVPSEEQAAAMRYALEVEEADVLLEAQLRHLWQAGVKLAYLDGRADAWRESLPEDTTPPVSRSDRNPVLH